MDEIQLSAAKKTVIGIQFLFVAFGSTVLVPLLVGLDPATALFTAGIGTLLFHLVTGGKVPIFLGSSFAFIAPIIAATKEWGMPGTIAGISAVACVYFSISFLIKWQGKRVLSRIFPPVVNQLDIGYNLTCNCDCGSDILSRFAAAVPCYLRNYCGLCLCCVYGSS